jgi:hypothetical protein
VGWLTSRIILNTPILADLTSLRGQTKFFSKFRPIWKILYSLIRTPLFLKIWVDNSSVTWSAKNLKFCFLTFLANFMHLIFRVLKFRILRVPPIQVWTKNGEMKIWFHEFYRERNWRQSRNKTVHSKVKTSKF